MITIRKAKLTDLDRMMEIYARAKRFMDSTGNTTQWEIGYPTRKMIQDDIENGYSFVCMGEDNIPHAAFKFFVGEDPTYRVIEQGSWKNDNTYGTIHRVASDGTIKGVFSQIVSFCEVICPELRADTHKDNNVMQPSARPAAGGLYLAAASAAHQRGGARRQNGGSRVQHCRGKSRQSRLGFRL